MIAHLAAPVLSFALPTAGAEPAELGAELPLVSLLPFALLLAAIALLPLFAHAWWERNSNKAIVAGGLAIPFAIWLVLLYGERAAHEINHALIDYLSFIALLGSLFVISGGIHLRGSLAGTPLSNSVMLGIGAVLANLIGTTGASMVLIRPFLRANEERHRRVHLIIFFIFVVSNCGGLLTPLGDPPLFLGFLKGVPFDWTLQLWREWLVMNGTLILVFNLVDQYYLNKEEMEGPEDLLEEVLEHEPLVVEGKHNFLLLLGVVVVIVGRGQEWGTWPASWPFGIQEGLMIALAFVSYVSTRPQIRDANRFTFAPIIEVAALFSGIFVTMTAPLLVLNARGSSLGLSAPWHFFWATGALSSFLDNAPTYLAFAATAAGQSGVSVDSSTYLAALLAHGAGPEALLAAISCGAVFMGSMTYIGNGPNFMVKAIAEENGIRMPSFFGYVAWSSAVLIPILLVVSFLFFRA